MKYDSETETRPESVWAITAVGRGGARRPAWLARGGVRMRRLSAAALAYACILLAPLVARADHFNGYQAGNWPSPTLSNSSNCLEGSSADYTVTVSNVGAPVTVLSIHGGGIGLTRAA